MSNSNHHGATPRRASSARRRSAFPAVVLGIALATGMTSCGGGGGDNADTSAEPSPTSPTPQPAPTPAPSSPAPVAEEPAEPQPSVMAEIKVAVPAGMATRPFDVQRTLRAPEGTAVSVFARVQDARFMAVAPNGDLLVSDTDNGNIVLLRPDEGGAARSFVFASGLTRPHDLVFHTVGAVTYLYIAQSNRIVRTVYGSGDTAAQALQTVVDNLPDASTPELRGTHLHALKNIALRDDKLYVSIASSCNACISDTISDPIRSAIYEYDLEGGNRRLYARGLRNAEGLAFRPGTSELWVTVNGRDRIAYPFRNDWDGDGIDDYGRVMQTYVDGHPPDVLTRVRDGGHYGWPFCNANPDNGPDNMSYDFDMEQNPDNSRFDCTTADRATKGLPAHSAPLGVSFLHDDSLPAALQNSIAIALHGCWNCTELNGHEIALYPLQVDGRVGTPIDLITGWITDAKERQRWGRPVDVVPDRRGGLFVSDDFSGTVYRVTFKE